MAPVPLPEPTGIVTACHLGSWGMTMRMRGAAVVILGVIMLAACGGAAGGGGTEPPPAGGGGNPYSGRLVAHGTSKIHDLDLSGNGRWTERLSGSNYEVTALRRAANELHIGGTSYGDPVTVASYDLDRFALLDTFVWPESSGFGYGRITGLAVSPDGAHLAAVFNGGSEPFLEVINRDSGAVIYSGHPGQAGTDMTWLTDELLVFAAEFSNPTPELAGGIVAVSLEDFAAASGTINMGVVVGFSADQWAVSRPADFAVSHDNSQLVYAWNKDLWVNDLAGAPSHQLTTGPTSLAGAVFSPDNRHIAFVEYQSVGLRDTFVLPNHREAPYFVSSSNRPDTAAFLLEASTLVEEILLWQD